MTTKCKLFNGLIQWTWSQITTCFSCNQFSILLLAVVKCLVLVLEIVVVVLVVVVVVVVVIKLVGWLGSYLCSSLMSIFMVKIMKYYYEVSNYVTGYHRNNIQRNTIT